MEKIRVIFVGKNKFSSLRELEREYEKKIGRIIPFKILEVKDIGIKDEKEKVLKESKNILKAMKGYTVLFDEKGELISSEEFAKFMNDLIHQENTISFIVGGFSGVSNAVKEKAHKKISFSKMTFSNTLSRVIALEQIYRAITIIKNISYHR